MTRIKRVYSNSKVYHIILKGIDEQNIFYDDQDRNVFLNDIKKTQKAYAYQLYSYCLMDNHVHMVIRIEKDFLSKAIQSLMIRYVQYFNKKYKRKGTLVQNRFKSKVVESQSYFLEVCRYVHRNPENAGMEKTHKYKWSSYQEYIGKSNLVDKDVLLNYFNNDIKEFINYTAKNNIDETLNEFAEYELIGKLKDEQVSKIIVKLFDIEDVKEIPYFFKDMNREELCDAIQTLKKIKGTNKTQLSRIIRITRCIIEKMWE